MRVSAKLIDVEVLKRCASKGILSVGQVEEILAAIGQTCRRLIDMAICRCGSSFLTYHKFATRDQVLACYPQFPEFLRLKRRYDPEKRFQNH